MQIVIESSLLRRWADGMEQAHSLFKNNYLEGTAKLNAVEDAIRDECAAAEALAVEEERAWK